MSDNTPTPHDDHTLALIGAALGLAVIIIAGIVAVAVAVPQSSNPSAIIVTLATGFSILIPQLINAIVGGRSAAKLDRVLNGEMDAKIKQNVHQALNERVGGDQGTEPAPATPPRPAQRP